MGRAREAWSELEKVRRPVPRGLLLDALRDVRLLRGLRGVDPRALARIVEWLDHAYAGDGLCAPAGTLKLDE